MSFCKVSKRRFHGLGVYVRNHLRGHILRVPDEDKDLEMVHLIIKNTTPVCNLFACYLDVESRAIQDKTSKVWHKLQGKIDAAIERGKAVILLGGLNRPLQLVISSIFGTNLLELWLEWESVTLLSDRNICTRINPPTGKSPLLDVGITSKNIFKKL